MDPWTSALLYSSRMKQRPTIVTSLLSNFPPLLSLHTSIVHSFYWMREKYIDFFKLILEAGREGRKKH